jgi:hypothetical protein
MAPSPPKAKLGRKEFSGEQSSFFMISFYGASPTTSNSKQNSTGAGGAGDEGLRTEKDDTPNEYSAKNADERYARKEARESEQGCGCTIS